MITLSDKMVSDIAEELDCGMRCFYNIKSKELFSIVDSDDFEDEDNTQSDLLEKIDANSSDYLEFEHPSSHDSFSIMEDFTRILDNEHLQEKLSLVLEGRKPFYNFKHQLAYYPDYRQQWFDFKLARNIEAIKEQVESFNQV